ncbi:MAG: SRPBCC domain-containing protein [Gemmataceae bacterium]
MVRLEGTHDLPLPPAELRPLLADPAFLVACVPDVEAVLACAPDGATLRVRPGLSFVRGALDVVLRVLDSPDADNVHVAALSSKGIGSTSELVAVLALAGEGDGTRVHWSVDVIKLGGLLKLVPPGLIHGAAKQIITDAWERVSERVKRPQA